MIPIRLNLTTELFRRRIVTKFERLAEVDIVPKTYQLVRVRYATEYGKIMQLVLAPMDLRIEC